MINEKFEALKTLLFETMKSLNIHVAEVEFEGSGDSGCIENVMLFRLTGKDDETEQIDEKEEQELLATDVPGELLGLGNKDADVNGLIEEVADCVLFSSEELAGWENNDGGRGTVTIYADSKKIQVDIAHFYIEEEWQEYSF